MKKIKETIFVAGLLVCSFILGACGSTVDAKSSGNFTISSETGEHGRVEVYNLVDEETKINYIVVAGYTVDGGGYSVAITPRLKSIGELYESK